MNYYNENDPKIAAELRELIAAGLIPRGVVDDRSITDVRPADLRGFDQCHFFAGIGGWALALRLAGVSQHARVWTASCPCQPFSVAGKGLGTKDERHLWPVFAELMRACKPPVAFGEQVASKDGRAWLAGVFADLEGMGYRRAGADLCAAGVGAPHIRQRLYWVADASSSRLDGSIKEPEVHSREKTRLCMPSADSGFSGMADAQHQQHEGILSGRREESCQDSSRQTGQPSGLGETRGMGDTEHSRLEGFGGAVNGSSEPGRVTESQERPTPAPGFWSDCTVIQCRDGKARRVPTEPAFFPLAHGIPARMVRLRGYGNAIVPQVAAEFIKASAEAGIRFLLDEDFC